MRINHNISALNTYNKLTSNTAATSKSLEKLSSGLKINRAGDNAAGLAISEKMRGQIRGLDQASTNSSDSISLIQTAEGALNETHSILQRMRELAVQSANDTNTTADRDEIQKEIDQLTTEITRIGDQTEFNTKKLLNGGAGLAVTMNSETVTGTTADWMSVVGGSSETASTGTIDITAATAATTASGNISVTTNTSGARSMTVNGTTINYTSTTSAAGTATAAAAAINAATAQTGVVAVASGADLYFNTTAVGSSASMDIVVGSGLTSGIDTADITKIGADATVTASGITGNFSAKGNTIKVTGGTYEGLELKLNGSRMNATGTNNLANFTITGNGALTMHIGANEGQTMGVSISDMRAEALGVNALDLTTQTGAESAITTIDSAIATVSAERSKLGAYQNRLEHTINNLGTSSENLTAAESRIRDVDMAKEMMEFTKNNILSQAAQSMLAQANQQPQGVLQLLQ